MSIYNFIVHGGILHPLTALTFLEHAHIPAAIVSIMQ